MALTLLYSRHMQYNKTFREIDSTFFNLLYPLVHESLNKKKVLLVESDIDVAATMETIFTDDRGIQLHIVRDADEAMILMIQTRFDLVVLEDHQYSPNLHHTGYIYKTLDSNSMERDIRNYFASH